MTKAMQKTLEEWERLISEAVYAGPMMIETRRDPWTHEIRKEPFREIIYYFNAKKEEIGHIVFPWSQFQSVDVCNPPRVWSERFFNSIHFTKFPLT